MVNVTGNSIHAFPIEFMIWKPVENFVCRKYKHSILVLLQETSQNYNVDFYKDSFVFSMRNEVPWIPTRVSINNVPFCIIVLVFNK